MLWRHRIHLASRRLNCGTFRSSKSDVVGARQAIPLALLPHASRRGNPPQVHQGGDPYGPPLPIAGRASARARGLLGRGIAPEPGHCARFLVLSSLFFSFLGRISGPALLPPIERVARGRRAPAAGLCARPGSRLGPNFRRVLIVVEVAGGDPKSGPRQA